MITKSFKDWDSEEVEKMFDLTRKWKDTPNLNQWLSNEKTHKSNPIIEELKEKLLFNADAWNEDELKMFFIAPLLNIVNIYHLPYYKPFTQRSLSIKTEQVDSKGEVEFLVATGRKNPEKPFFFLREYKQEEKRNNDALGQLLIAMMAAQLNNEDDIPLYGCYVLGRFWFFVLLEGQEYAVSKAFDASQDAIYEIITILEKVKNFIEAYFHSFKSKI